jgi:hypothetical protein
MGGASDGHRSRSRTHEGAASSPAQEPRVNECGQQRLALGPTELPQALCLFDGEAKPWHFEILGANAPHDVIDSC